MNTKLLKLITIGDSRVGKTSIMMQYVEQKFTEQYKATIGADFLSKEVCIDGQPIMIQLWDTAGEERFQSLGTAFYRGSDIMYIIYDVTNRNSFTNVESWLESLHATCGNLPCVVLVGNKIDLPDRRVTTKEGQDMAKKHDLLFYEISAKTNDGISELFIESILQSLLQIDDVHYYADTPDIKKVSSPKNTNEDSCLLL